MDKQKDSIFENHTEQQLIKAVLQLLGGVFDKNESFRIAVETSLIAIAENNTDMVILMIMEFREKTQKIDEHQLAILYQMIETIIRRFGKIKEETMEKLVQVSLDEILKIADLVPTVQKPIIDTIIALSRMNSSVVIPGLMNYLTQEQPAHFMLLHTLGELSTANTIDMVQYLKKIFAQLLPTMIMVRNDHLKQAYCFAIGKFCETITENIEELKHSEGDEFSLPDSLDFGVELAIAYDIIFHQWLFSREAKVCNEVLLCLAHLFPLLRAEKVSDQICRVITNLLGLYRKTIDRLSITKCLGASIQTGMKVNPLILDPVHLQLIGALFDLVCVNPDYEKPQTVTGHYEVLRCFDFLTQRQYEGLVMDTLLTQLRSNMERDRIKSLQLLVHFCSTREKLVLDKLGEFTKILRQMIVTERMVRIKMHLLKTIVAFAQKGFIEDKAFIKFILRFSCELTKPPLEFGTDEDHREFQQTCNHSLYILSSTVATVDEIMKRELLSALMQSDYYTALETILKCLGKLFERSVEITAEELESSGEEGVISTLTLVPAPIAVFVRCLALLDNPVEKERTIQILLFLRSFAPVVEKHLQTLWDDRVAGHLRELNVVKGKETPKRRSSSHSDIAPSLLLDTIKDIDGTEFVLRVIAELKIQRGTYYLPHQQQEHQKNVGEFKTITSLVERGNLYKLLGICLSQIEDGEELKEGLELLIETAKGEKLEKNSPFGVETVIPAIGVAFGYAAKKHFRRVFEDLIFVMRVEGKRSPSGMLSKLNFVKENNREMELIKVRTFVLSSLVRVVENFPKTPEDMRVIEEKLVEPLLQEFQETATQNLNFRKMIVEIVLQICQSVYESFPEYELRTREAILRSILTVRIDIGNLQLLPNILLLGTILIKMNVDSYSTITNDHEIISQVCTAFFSIAKELKTKFDSVEDDERNSFIAGHLNKSLPQLIAFVQVIVKQNPTPACLDVITTIVERWAQDHNSEVRISAGHVIKEILTVYIRTMKFGGEAPSKFSQTGMMVGKTMPRCLDTNATVRQLSVDVLQRILEISCIYETLVIPTVENAEWMKKVARIRAEIVTNDFAEVVKLAKELCDVVAGRLPEIQYKQFASTLMLCVDDTVESSAVGAAILLTEFVKLKGQTIVHHLPAFVADCMTAVGGCSRDKAKVELLKALVALAKHFPQQVCAEMLNHDLPFDPLLNHFWRLICKDDQLAEQVIEHFLSVLQTSCLIDTTEKTKYLDPLAAVVPLRIFYALKEMLLSVDCREVSKRHFEEIFGVLIASLACYINTGPPLSDKVIPAGKVKNYKPPPTLQLPAQTILDTIEGFLTVLDLEQLRGVFYITPDLAHSKDLWKLVELIAPLAVALGQTLGIHSGEMKKFVVIMSRYTASTYEAHRVASVALLCQLLTLSPTGEVVNTIMTHLKSSLNDPNMLARCCAVQGLGNLRYLNEYDANSYVETSVMALMHALDVNSEEEPKVNLPLESLRGLMQILGLTNRMENLKMYTINLAIRIRPFFENKSAEIRELAISLFGQLCVQQSEVVSSSTGISEEFEEQVYRYFFPLLLHLSETENSVVIATRLTIKKAVILMEDKTKTRDLIEKNLLEYGHLNYDIFLWDLLRVVNEEFSFDLLQHSIESCLPFLKSQWPELRGNAVVMVAVLGNHLNNNHPDAEKHHEPKNRTLTLNHLAEKVTQMLKDESSSVRVKAALSMGHLFTGI